LDAAILFSDILTIPDAMGLGLYFETGEGPRFSNPVTCRADVERLPVPDPEMELGYVMNAVRTIRKNLNGDLPLIGFSGSPWTLATYMVEGGSSKAFTKIKKMMYADPATLHAMLDKLADSVILYLNAQIRAGAQSVMVFDTWGGVLTGRDYREFSLHYMHKIVDGLLRENDGRRVPVTLFTKGGGQWLEAMAATGCDALGLDWTTDIDDARRRVGDKVALQGNMDPSMLYAAPERIEQEVAGILERFGSGTGHVFNLGHGIHLDVPPENAGVFVEAVHRLSRPWHQE
ncbi:MAG: uroporphyrinogen decarboxylase, partial [Pantoea agglomerans]